MQMEISGQHALDLEHTCSFLASTFSSGRIKKCRLVTGEYRHLGLNPEASLVKIPVPYLDTNWNLRTICSGVALQCSPSKLLITHLDLREFSVREINALTLAEAEVAMAWISRKWPGLISELQRNLPNLEISKEDADTPKIIERAYSLVRSTKPLCCPPLLGQLPTAPHTKHTLMTYFKRLRGQMPWSTKRKLSPTLHTIPVAGDGGVKNTNLPPPSRPKDDLTIINSDQRIGIPYPEWNRWTRSFLQNHVAVLERQHNDSNIGYTPTSTALRSWFEKHTHRAMKSGLHDGTEVDVDRYIQYVVDGATGTYTEPRIFRDLSPAHRDVTTAVLLDGSDSLSAQQGRIFRLQLACADALSHTMAQTKEKHGVFVFSGNTRHRVEVICLKDFNQRHQVIPGELNLKVGGYTRLGAPIRHLTSRLLKQSSERRCLIIIGDGLISDEGYEGYYAWDDVAHAIEESAHAGISVYYIGIGPVKVDPLPDVFGPKQSTRINSVDELPRVLANIHRLLIAF